MVKKIFAVVALSMMAVFAAPLAANAAGYVPPSSVSVTDSTPAPGQTVSCGFAAGAFQANEDVHFTLTGENASAATLATLRSAISSASLVRTASASGSTSVAVTLPSSASGSYTLSATGVRSGNIATLALTVAPASAAAASGSSSSSTTSGSGLADTGSNISLLAVWGAAGIVALGLAFIVVSVIVRRQRASKA